MSSKTDMAFAAGLLGALSGAQADRREENFRQAELARQEGLMRLQSRIQKENSPSGWVDKQTGKPILMSELGSYPEASRVTAGDFNLSQSRKAFNAEQEMMKPVIAEERAYEESQAEKDRQLRRDIYGQTTRKGSMTQAQWVKEMNEANQEYFEGGYGESTTEGGLLGFGEKEVPGTERLAFLQERYPELVSIGMENGWIGGQGRTLAEEGGDVVQPRPIRPGEAQAAGYQAPDNDVKATIDKYRKKGGRKATTEKKEKSGGLLSDLKEWGDSPAQEGIATAKKKISDTAGTIGKTLSSASQKTADRDEKVYSGKPTQKMLEYRGQFRTLKSKEERQEFIKKLVKRNVPKDAIEWITQE